MCGAGTTNPAVRQSDRVTETGARPEYAQARKEATTCEISIAFPEPAEETGEWQV